MIKWEHEYHISKKNVEKKVLERNKDTGTIWAQKSDSCINGQKGKAKFFIFHCIKKPHPRGLPGGMVTGKLNNQFVTLLLDLYCFSVLKIDEPKIYGKYGKYKTDFLTKYQI